MRWGGEDVGGVAGVRVGDVARDHAADLVLGIDLVPHGDAARAREELVVEGLVALLGIVPGSVAEGHGDVVARRQDARAHDVAEASHEQAVDLVEGEPVAHEPLVLGHDGVRVVEVEPDELGVRPAAVVLGQVVGELIVRERDHRLDAALAALLEHAPVELDARPIGLAFVPAREDSAPVDGHAVVLEAHLAEQRDVVEVMAVHVHSLMGGVEDAGLDAVGHAGAAR